MNKIFVDITKLLEIEDGTEIFAISSIDYSNLTIYSRICVSKNELQATLKKIEEMAKIKDSEVVTNWHYPTSEQEVHNGTEKL